MLFHAAPLLRLCSFVRNNVCPPPSLIQGRYRETHPKLKFQPCEFLVFTCSHSGSPSLCWCGFPPPPRTKSVKSLSYAPPNFPSPLSLPLGSTEFIASQDATSRRGCKEDNETLKHHCFRLGPEGFTKRGQENSKACIASQKENRKILKHSLLHTRQEDYFIIKHALLHKRHGFPQAFTASHADGKTAVKINGMLIMNTSKEALFTVTNTSQRSSIAVWGRETVTECMHFSRCFTLVQCFLTYSHCETPYM